MNKSILKEYDDPQTRLKVIQTGDVDRSIKLLFQWIKTSQIDYNEFEDLLVELIYKTIKMVKS